MGGSRVDPYGVPHSDTLLFPTLSAHPYSLDNILDEVNERVDAGALYPAFLRDSRTSPAPKCDFRA